MGQIKKAMYAIFIFHWLLLGGLCCHAWAKELIDYYKEGKQASDQGRYEDAIKSWEEGFKQAEKMKYYGYQMEFAGSMGLLYEDLGQYESANKCFQSALAVSKTVGNRTKECAILYQIGQICQKLYQNEKALSYYKQALTISRNIGLRREEGYLLNNIGVVYNNHGQYPRALGYFEQALIIKRALDDRQGEGDILNNIGAVCEGLGQYQKALDYYENALGIAREIGNRQLEGYILGNIGMVYSGLGQSEKALSYYEQALAIRRALGDRQGEGQILSNIGAIKVHQPEKALVYLERALAIAREIGSRGSEGYALGNIALAYDNLGRLEEALEHYEKALAIERETGNGSGQAAILSNIGLAYLACGQYEKSVRHFNESIKICKDVGSLDSLWRAQFGLGIAEFELDEYDDGVKHYEQAVDTIEAIRIGLTENETKTSFMREKLFVYDRFIEVLNILHQKFPGKGYDQKSFEIFERKQGRVFLEEMGQSGARNFAGLPDAVREHEADLEGQLGKVQSELVALRSKPAEDRSTELIKNLEARQAELIAEKDNLVTEIKARYPGYHALKYPQPVSLAELQKKVLQTDEVMLIYAVVERQSYLWVVTKQRFGFLAIAEGEAAVRDRVDAFRKGPQKLMQAINQSPTPSALEKTLKRARKQMTRAAREIYQVVLPEQARRLIIGAKTLYVIPTGPLYGLPFEALVTRIDDDQTPHYLIEDHAVVYLSSSSLLKALRQARMKRKDTARHPLLAFAHPVYRDSKGSAPDDKAAAGGDLSTIASLRNRAYRDLLGGSFVELPETEAEVREIQTILNAPAASGALQLREKASRSNVLSLNKDGKLADYRYVVFACHGILPGEIDRVSQPALVLSNPDPQTHSEGFLTMADVFGISLNAEMVTLSACNTGRGKAEKGEGVRGLTRAFMYAGTPAISVTLWSVESQSAKRLSTGLYRNLKQGKSRSEALRQVKLRMIRGAEGELFQHPFFWAPVVIFGDGA